MCKYSQQTKAFIKSTILIDKFQLYYKDNKLNSINILVAFLLNFQPI